MATVRQSIMALYEQSRKSAAEGQAMFAVIESEAMTPVEVDFEIRAGDGRPPIARRFDDLRNLAEREMPDRISPRGAPPPSTGMTGTAQGHPVAGSGDSTEGPFDAGEALPAIDSPPPPAISGSPDSDDIGGDTNTDMNTDMNTDRPASASEPALPNEPPAPASSDAMADLDVADIQKLVRQAWEDKTALGSVDGPAGTDIDRTISDAGNTDSIDDPDMEAAMQDIAAAVGKSDDSPEPVDLAAIKTELVAAMRSELQALVTADLRPMIKAAIAEALQELPAAQPKTRANKAAAAGTAGKKAAGKKAATRAKKTQTAKKKSDS